MPEEENHSENELNREKVEQTFDETIKLVTEINTQAVRIAQDTGYIRDVLIAAKPIYVSLAEQKLTNSEYEIVCDSGVRVVSQIQKSLINGRTEADYLGGSIISPVFIASGSFAGTVTAVVSGMDQSTIVGFTPIPDPIPHGSEEIYVEYFKSLDPALAKTYKEAWETFYGTSADPYRAALFMMRQTFDHFFDILAPDKDVISSSYWTPKTVNDPNAVYRNEKMSFVCGTKIKDQKRADLLAASTKSVLALYNSTNRAHERGELNEEKARKTLFALDIVFKDWVDALND